MMYAYTTRTIALLFTLTIFTVTALMPQMLFAKGHELEVSGWIPYWRDTEGIKDAKKHIKTIDAVYPFVFTVTTAGEIRDQGGLDEREWKSFVKYAQRKKVDVIPTIMWSDGGAMQTVLGNAVLRAAHVKNIAKMVKDGDFDGVDIDYEGKKSETRDGFSLFLKELKAAIGNKELVCTIEPRTPPESLYREVPAVINYVNDYAAIGKHCDQVTIMAYDQQRADIKLNATRKGAPYMPVSDVDWVEKVLELTIKSIPKEKIVLGIPTYGHHYSVTVAPDWYRDYWKLGALNVPSILDLAEERDVEPSRNAAGEMGFSYIPDSSVVASYKKNLRIPKNTPSGEVASAKALAYANATGKEATFNIVSYSDAGAMKEKIDLARKFELRGVALFKIDGEEDQKVWKYLR
jgi:spore germination protein YaaH